MIPMFLAPFLGLAFQAQGEASGPQVLVPEAQASSGTPAVEPGLLDQQVRVGDEGGVEAPAAASRLRVYQRFIVRRLPGGNGDVYEVEVMRDEPVSSPLVSAIIVPTLGSPRSGVALRPKADTSEPADIPRTQRP